MKKFLFAFLLLGFFSCKDDAPFIDDDPILVDEEPEQYGVPFTGVPDREDAIIYQVNIRAFSAEGNLAGVTKRLDAIKDLGVNVIYLMPIYPVGSLKSINSPYCVKDYVSVSPEFGTLADLRALVDSAHRLNMSVMLDWVANHTAWDHAWIAEHKDWYQQSAGNIINPPGWNDVAQLNFNSTALQAEMIKSMKYWVYAANIDGFRFDYADGVPVTFWSQAVQALRKIATHKLLLLAEGNRNANYSAGFDYNFGFSFYGQLRDVYGKKGPFTAIDLLNISEEAGALNGQQVVRYTTNHDVNSSDGTPLSLFGGRNGSMTAFVIAVYMKGVPMIYGGQEVGTTFQLFFPFTEQHIDWSLNPDITAEYRKIIAFRKASTAIRRGALVTYSNADVCAFTKETTGERVFVVANVRNSLVKYTLPSTLAGTAWTDAMSGGAVNLGTELSLQPFSYLVLKQ